MVLGELNTEAILNAPTKRKHNETRIDELPERKRVPMAVIDKENSAYTRAHVNQNHDDDDDEQTGVFMSSASQETLADNPESQDTIPDSNLPSSSSNQTKDRMPITPPQSQKKPGIVSGDDARSLASNMKCRLKLAMYKMQCHKEELNYKKLLPRGSPAFTVGVLPTPPTQQRPKSMTIPSQLKTPGPVTSIISNERSVPGLMHRSSSGDTGPNDTPVRRYYDIGLSSPPNSQEALQLVIEPRLPDVQLSPGKEHVRPTLPSVKDWTAKMDAQQAVKHHEVADR